MNGALTTDPLVLAAFDRACAAVTSEGSGITLAQLGTAMALAEAWVADQHDRVREHAKRLGIDPEAL